MKKPLEPDITKDHKTFQICIEDCADSIARDNCLSLYYWLHCQIALAQRQCRQIQNKSPELEWIFQQRITMTKELNQGTRISNIYPKPFKTTLGWIFKTLLCIFVLAGSNRASWIPSNGNNVTLLLMHQIVHYWQQKDKQLCILLLLTSDVEASTMIEVSQLWSHGWHHQPPYKV